MGRTDASIPIKFPQLGDTTLEWLDEAADKVRLATEHNYFKFLDNPGAFDNSQARYCMVCLVTVLQQQCGVHYNPNWKGLTPDSPVPKAFGNDASDLFIHAIIDGIGGTCGSLPVLYVAVGRRLGYPLRLVKAARHLFVRWDDPDGKHWHHTDRFNIEATGPGVHFLPDDHYRTWPHAISEEDIETGIFLRSLSSREEFAEFLATRGYCLKANGRFGEAVKTFAEALRLAPHNRHFAATHQALRMHVAMRQRGHTFLNASIRTFDQESVGPFWIDGFGGQMLVQIVSPVTQPINQQPNLGTPLIRQYLQTPNGLHVEAWLLLQSVGSPMTAHWVSLPDGRQALVHKPVTHDWTQPSHAPNRFHQRSVGQLVVPESDRGMGLPWSGSYQPDGQAGIPVHEQSYLATRIQQAAERVQSQSRASELPSMPPLAISAGPAVPRLPSSSVEIPLIT